jgi:inorganic pyrophosphatase
MTGINVMEVIIETPRGSTEKYDYDRKHHCFKLKKILPSGMVFPYDFGFIPGTKGEDGDPLDVIVISEYKSFPGCLMDCRIIGAILAEQQSENGKIRNDRYLAVPTLSSIFEDIQTIQQLPRNKLKELKAFFINYNKIEGKKFKALKIIKSKKAYKLIGANKNA